MQDVFGEINFVSVIKIIDMKKSLFYVFWFLLVSLTLCSCETMHPESDTDHQLSFVLESAADMSSSVSLALSSDWIVEGTGDWFSVSPLVGGSGTVDIEVRSLSENVEITEREAQFTLSVSDGTPVQCFVIQRGTPGLIINEDLITVDSAGGTLNVPVRANIDFTVESDSDWLVPDGGDSTSRVLSDGITRSALADWTMHFKVLPFEGEGSRSAVLTFRYGDDSIPVTVVQSDKSEVDWSKDFYRRTLGMRFTATWCGFCAMMAESFVVAQEELPDRIVPFNLHPSSSEGGLHYDGTEDMEKLFGVSMYPTAVFNNYVTINNSNVNTCSRIIRQIAEEAVVSLPAKTGIKAVSSVSGDQIELNVRVAMKEDLNYKVSAFLLESGMVYPQESGGDDYIHKDVVRANVSDIYGDRLPDTGDNVISEISFSTAFPENIQDRSRVFWVIYVTRPDSFVGEVPMTEYVNVGTIVDNVVSLGLNGSVEFEYEQ